MRSELTQVLVIGAMVLALLVGVIGLVGFRHLSGAFWGRVALLVAVALLPLSVSFAGLHAGMAESGRTRFCLGCHEMQNHGKTLFADNRRALAATHYQSRLVDRDRACYGCHADYALFGDVTTKINGLRHVWVHYLGNIPDKFKLYQPYSNQNCLRCHEDARRYLENEPHKALVPQLASGEVSCLKCHSVSHDMETMSRGELWQAP